MLPIRDPNHILDEVGEDPNYTEAERELIAAQLKRIASDDADASGGAPRMGLPRWTGLVHGTDPPITITFEIARPGLYPENRAGVWLIDIRRLET